VSDLVAGLMRLATVPAARNQVVNLGNPAEVSVLEMARLVKRLSGSVSSIHHLPPRPEEIARRRPAIEKAARVLDWRPQVGIEDGIARTIEWFRAHRAERAP
jgi:nucleoside-diphosphate-sugar epimerase